MTEARKYYRHGDLLFLKIDEIPQDFVNRKKEPKAHSRGVVVAEGEKTGHHHTLEKDHCKEYYDYQFNNGRISFFKIDEPTKVEHEEHGTIVLEPGTYQLNFQREVDLGAVHYPSTSAIEEATRIVQD